LAFFVGSPQRCLLYASVALKLFLRDPIDSGQMIDFAITWRKVNATKKIREFCLMGTFSANKNTIGRLWRERIFCGFHSPLAFLDIVPSIIRWKQIVHSRFQQLKTFGIAIFAVRRRYRPSRPTGEKPCRPDQSSSS